LKAEATSLGGLDLIGETLDEVLVDDGVGAAKKAGTWEVKWRSLSLIGLFQSCKSLERSISSAAQKRTKK
jgi:hypothetical protein